MTLEIPAGVLNLYHTSLVVPTPFVGEPVAVASLKVSLVSLPETLQSVLGVNVVTDVQRSLPGGAANEYKEKRHTNEVNRIRFMILQGLVGFCKSRMTVLTHL